MSDPDTVTEITRTGFGSRLGGSLVGVLIGLLMVVISVPLLWWNEGRAVQAATALSQGERSVVEASAGGIDNALSGKLVHVTGPLESTGLVRDGTFGVGGRNVVRLHRSVEMYQWKQSEKTETHNEVGGGQTKETTYTYTRVWSATPIDSARFHSPNGHQNPQMPLASATIDGNAKLGAYRVDPAVLREMDNFEPFAAGAEARAPNGYRAESDGFYRGANSASPAIGDVRVTFTAVTAQTMSVVAAQAGNALAPFRSDNGYEIKLATPGVASAIEMLKEQEKSERVLTWILRAVGFGLMLFGLWLFAGPVAALAYILPFLGGLVEAGAFLLAFVIALPATLVIIAVAWLAHRPLIGGGLLVVGAIVLIGGIVMHHRRRPAKAAT